MNLAEWVVDTLRARGRTPWLTLDRMLLMHGHYDMAKLKKTLEELVAIGRIKRTETPDGDYYDICMLRAV